MAYMEPYDPVIDFSGSQLLSAGGEIPLGRVAGATTAIGLTNQGMRMVFFTARKTETITKVRTFTTGQAQIGATLAQVGVYTVDASDNITLIHSTTNDTSMWSATNTAYTKSLSSSWAKVRGTRYAIGLLEDGTSTTANVAATAVTAGYIWAVVPRINALVSSQASLPASVAVGSLTATTIAPYVELLP